MGWYGKARCGMEIQINDDGLSRMCFDWLVREVRERSELVGEPGPEIMHIDEDSPGYVPDQR